MHKHAPSLDVDLQGSGLSEGKRIVPSGDAATPGGAPRRRWERVR